MEKIALILQGIALPFDRPEAEAVERARQKLQLPGCEAAVYRRSIDARDKTNIKRVYSVLFGVGEKDRQRLLKKNIKNLAAASEPGWSPEPAKGAKRCRPVIIGFGPAGMFAGLALARRGYRPVILERGGDIDKRVKSVERFFEGGPLDPECNIQFGEGGAGTFSDGKLTTRTGSPLCAYVLSEFVKYGADAGILVDAKPHIGTDVLRSIVKNIRGDIISCGGSVFFDTRAESVLESPEGVVVRTAGETFLSEAVILSVGHSARDTVKMLWENGFSIAPKAFSCGVRIEQKRSAIDTAMYGAFAGHPLLPPAEYQFSDRAGGRGVYTFCMCPGGTVVAAASEPGGVAVNGMSFKDRGMDNSNSALVVSVSPSDFGHGVFDGIEFQRGLEQAAFKAGGSCYCAPAQTAEDFLSGARSGAGSVLPTYLPGVRYTDLNSLFPSFITERLKAGLLAFESKAKGFYSGGAVLTAPETRTSSPVRILRDTDFQADGKKGLYPCGEGAGYAGGIMSAAVDGLRVAGAIIERFSPP